MPTKALPAAMAAAAFSVLTLAAATPATAATSSAAAVHTVRVQLHTVTTVKESAGAIVSCPDNQVMTGRSHTGDENGYTKYSCSQIFIDDEQVTVERRGWVGVGRESSSLFEAPENQVIVGRRHSGNENGYTYYEQAALWWQGRQLRVVLSPWGSDVRESNHSVSASPYHVMTGRVHYGDENGYTAYRFGSVTVD
ncbi:hypothetical protein GCM10017559_50360 [Streptosporangium longisporum]|uniref:Allene oxide cyclase barrel-like domain-containing protein n=2 Tax=Streptosporangium longisporum TaxID=46187 RepID=A0ABN3Y9C3_9ACTN